MKKTLLGVLVLAALIPLFAVTLGQNTTKEAEYVPIGTNSIALDLR